LHLAAAEMNERTEKGLNMIPLFVQQISPITWHTAAPD